MGTVNKAYVVSGLLLLILGSAVVWSVKGMAGDKGDEYKPDPNLAATDRPQQPSANGIAWEPNYKVALDKAKRENKIMMIDFMATWCGPCKMLDRDTFHDAEVVKSSKRFVCVQIDVDKEVELGQKYGASALPTVVFVKPDTTPFLGHKGYMDPANMVAMMNDALKQAKNRSTK